MLRFYSSRVFPQIVLVTEGSSLSGKSLKGPCVGHTTPLRIKTALRVCSSDRRPGAAVGAEDVSRWRVMMISIEVPVST